MPTSRIEALQEFLREDPEDEFTRFALATEYMKAGNVAAARSHYERLLQERPDYVGTYYHLGALYIGIGERGLALETYRRGIEVAQSQRDTHARAELQSALLEAEGFGFDDHD